MKFVVENSDLKLLLEKRRDFISGWKQSGAVATGCSMMFAGLTSEFPDLTEYVGVCIRFALIAAGVLLVVYGIITAIRNRRFFYGHRLLYDEIMGIDTKKHQFSIVVIKDTYNDYANRYLLRYVKDWDCDLFFSFPTKEEGNEENIKDKLSSALHIDKGTIHLKYSSEDFTTKYSVKDKVTKIYDHKFYVATLSRFPDELKQETFTIDDVRYKWMSYPKMEDDKRIREANLDIVQYVKDHVA